MSNNEFIYIGLCVHLVSGCSVLPNCTTSIPRRDNTTKDADTPTCMYRCKCTWPTRELSPVGGGLGGEAEEHRTGTSCSILFYVSCMIIHGADFYRHLEVTSPLTYKKKSNEGKNTWKSRGNVLIKKDRKRWEKEICTYACAPQQVKYELKAKSERIHCGKKKCTVY